MQLNRNDLQHITTVQHEGRVLLLGIDSQRDIFYAVKRSPEAIANVPASENDGTMPVLWGDWQRLSLPDDPIGDPSVEQRQRETGVYELVRSRYNTADQTALAPIQAVSYGEHLHIFRQSLDGTLLMDRFVLDGGSDRLVRKIEVRFKRSGQRYEPLQPTGIGSNREFDSPDYRDFEGNFFFEPTHELRLINGLQNGWFSVAITSTSELDVQRWHIFAYRDGAIELVSLRRTDKALFDLRDHTVAEGTVDAPQARLVPGVMRRRLTLQDEDGTVLAPQDRPTATTFCLQSETTTQDGEPSLVKAGVRVMLTVPAGPDRQVVALSFAVRTDGTLANIDPQPQQSLLHEENQDVLLPADLLQQVNPAQGDRIISVVPERMSLVFDGVDDFVDVGSGSSLNVTNRFTIEAWIRPRRLTGFHTIFGKVGAYDLAIADGELVLNTQTSIGTQGAPLIPDEWQHVAVVMQWNGRVQFYHNGQLFSTASGSPARISPRNAYLGSLDGVEGQWDGGLADVRLWNTALTQAEIDQRRDQRLLGRELGLVGYWLLSGVVDGRTADFSLETNDGRVQGAMAAVRTLPRDFRRRGAATAYRYDEVFSVAQGRTYLESFEYRLDPAAPFDAVTEAFDIVFWGRQGGRDGENTPPVAVTAEIAPGMDTEGGWRRATARFTIPPGMTHLRYFHITPPGGEWTQLELRQHRIEQLASTITQADYADVVSLPHLADDFGVTEQSLQQLAPLESQEGTLLTRIEELDELLNTDDPQAAFDQRIASLDQDISRLRSRQLNLDLEQANPFHRYAEIQPSQRFGSRLHLGTNSVVLQSTNETTRQDWKLVQEASGAYSIRSRFDSNQVFGTGQIFSRGERTDVFAVARYAPNVAAQQWQVNIRVPNALAAEAEIALQDNPGSLLSLNSRGQLVLAPRGTAGLEQAWVLRNTQEIHPEGQAAIAAAIAESQRLDGEIAALQQQRQRLERDRDTAQATRDRLNTILNELQAQIRAIRDRYLAQIAAIANRPQDLAIVANLPNNGIVKGAILDFATAAGSITAYESVEAEVRLNAFDTRGRIRTHAYDAIAEQWRIDTPGNCVAFPPSPDPDAYLAVENFAAADLTNFTLEIWIRTSDRQRQGSLISYTNPSVTNGNGLWLYRPSNLKLMVNNHTSGDTGVNIADGQWHHLALTWQSFTGRFQLYVDGAAVYGDTIAQGEAIAHGGTLILGQDQDQMGGGFEPHQSFTGSMDLVRIWDVALGVAEVEANRYLTLKGDEPGLIAYWTLDSETAERQVLDHSPNNHHATLHGDLTLVPSTAPIGVIPQTVFTFGGDRNHIDVGTDERFNLTNRFTLEAWFRMDGITGRRRIFFKDEAYGLGTNNDEFIFTSRNRQDYFTTQANLQPGRWYHVAAILDGNNDLQVYLDGEFLETISGARPAPISNGRCRIGIGIFQQQPEVLEPWQGELADIRLWNIERTPEQIQTHRFRRLSGTEAGLVGYWRLDGLQPDGTVADVLGQRPGTIIQEAVPKSDVYLPIWDADIPILIANEYTTQERDEQGQSVALMRRFYAYLRRDDIYLLTDQRIEDLEVRWVGNAQFEPTLLGYIEGAPPVPSENLTVEDTYDGIASVQLNTAESVSFSWRREQEAGLGLDVEAILGSYAEIETGVSIPIIGGVEVSNTVSAGIGFAGNLSASYNFINQAEVNTEVNLGFSDRLELRGTQESDPQFPLLGLRYQPKNIGYALVISSLADVFVLRLRRSRKMVSYQVVPVPDLPPEVNTITFLINPAHLQNGTLDGQIGTAAADDRFYGQVPDMRANFGSEFPASYFRIREAAALQAQIRQQDRDREAFFTNFNSRLVDETSLNRSVGGFSENEDEIQNQGGNVQDQIESSQPGNVQSSSNTVAWQRRLEQLQVQARKRNIVNTYVWDGDGGMRTETQDFASTVEQTIGGTFTLDTGIGATGLLQGLGVWVELTALATAHLTQTMTKTESRSQGFSLEVEVAPEHRGITDARDRPLLPGEKVDRYRFSSFYLEPSTDHFTDFFNQVVDPEWLMSNDEEARALRQINPTRPNRTWRVRHLVTFVERPALAGFGASDRDTTSFLANQVANRIPTPNGTQATV